MRVVVHGRGGVLIHGVPASAEQSKNRQTDPPPPHPRLSQLSSTVSAVLSGQLYLSLHMVPASVRNSHEGAKIMIKN